MALNVRTGPVPAPSSAPSDGRHMFTPRTGDLYDLYDLFPLRDVGPSGKIEPCLYDLARVARWEPCNLHDTARISWIGTVL